MWKEQISLEDYLSVERATAKYEGGMMTEDSQMLGP